MITIKEASLFCKDGDWIESKDQSPSGIRLIQTGNIGIGTYLDKISRAKYISEETFERLECTEVFPGDIVISRLPDPVGRACIVPDGLGRTITAVDCTILRVDEKKFLKEYVLLYSETEQYKAQIEKFLAGSTRVRISRKNLESISIPQKTFEIQRNIVSKIYKIKNIITLRKQQLSKLDQLVKSRFIEMFGDPVANDKNWPIEKLDSICSAIVDCPHSTPSYTAENTGFMCIRSSIVKENHILWDKIEYIPEHEYHKRILRKKPQKGDIIYTREGAILGIAAIIDRDCNIALGQRSMLLSPDNSKCLPQFLSVSMNFDSFLRKVLGGISGSASPHINVGDIKAFAIILPPIALQEQFVIFVQQIDKVKASVKQSLEKLETLKKSLMQEYFE